MARTKALPKPAALAAEAEALYVAEAKATKARVLSPVAATKAMAEKYGGGTARVASPVARVYYRKNGERNPLALSPDASDAAIRKAVRERRDSPGLADGSGFSPDGNASLGRFETLAASLAAALGRRVSGAEIRRMFDDPGYVGRGTKAATPASR